jgi:hypothetical protein
MDEMERLQNNIEKRILMIRGDEITDVNGNVTHTIKFNEAMGIKEIIDVDGNVTHRIYGNQIKEIVNGKITHIINWGANNLSSVDGDVILRLE